MSKTVYEHLSPVCPDRPAFHRVHGLFWTIAKESDSRSVSQFPREWQKLVDLVKESCTPGARLDKALEWLESLGRKAEQFCYRFTWSVLTYSMHATSRIEACNSAIKAIVVRVNMSITELVVGLIDYNKESRAGRHHCEVRLAMKQLLAAGGRPPWIEAFRSTVTPYAFDLICAQVARAHSYRVTEVPLGWGGDLEDADVDDNVYDANEMASKTSKKYLVMPYQGSYKRNDPTYDAEGAVVNCVDCDDGFEDSTSVRGRLCSLEECSCMWPTNSGLGLCSHQCKLMMKIVDELDEAEAAIFGAKMASKWKVLSPDDEAEATRILRSMPSMVMPEERPQNEQVRNPPTAGRSTADRYALLIAELKALADTASVSENGTEYLRREARHLHDKLHELNVPSSSRKSTGPPGAASASMGDDTPPDVPIKETNDYKNLVTQMGESLCLATVEDSWFGFCEEGDEEHEGGASPNEDTFINEWVAIKFAQRNRGKWFICQVAAVTSARLVPTDSSDDENEDVSERCYKLIPLMETSSWSKERIEVNFELYCPDDETTVHAALYEANCANASGRTDYKMNCLAGTWVWLKEEGLGDDLATLKGATVHAPRGHAQQGQRRSKRGKPLHGPGSSQKQKVT